MTKEEFIEAWFNVAASATHDMSVSWFTLKTLNEITGILLRVLPPVCKEHMSDQHLLFGVGRGMDGGWIFLGSLPDDREIPEPAGIDILRLIQLGVRYDVENNAFVKES